MKKLIIAATIAIATLSAGVYFLFFYNRVNSNFATEAHIRFTTFERFDDSRIEFTQHELIITDEEDLAALRRILRGRTRPGGYGCGFSDDESIIMSNGNRSITFKPAQDGCTIVRVGDSDLYFDISRNQRIILNELFERFRLAVPHN